MQMKSYPSKSLFLLEEKKGNTLSDIISKLIIIRLKRCFLENFYNLEILINIRNNINIVKLLYLINLILSET